MGLMDKFKDFINAPVEEDDDYDFDTEDSGFNGKASQDDDENISSKSRSSYSSYSSYDTPREREPRRERDQSAGASSKGKIYNMNSGAQVQMVLVKPERFEDGISIADHLNSKRTVVLNLEAANREVSRRLVDFLSGVAYANDGILKRVANSTFVITPSTVDIMGDLLIDELENATTYSF